MFARTGRAFAALCGLWFWVKLKLQKKFYFVQTSSIESIITLNPPEAVATETVFVTDVSTSITV